MVNVAWLSEGPDCSRLLWVGTDRVSLNDVPQEVDLPSRLKTLSELEGEARLSETAKSFVHMLEMVLEGVGEDD